MNVNKPIDKRLVAAAAWVICSLLTLFGVISFVNEDLELDAFNCKFCVNLKEMNRNELSILDILSKLPLILSFF